MARFCGALRWRHARDARASGWPSMHARLGPDAVDVSPRLSERAHMAVWRADAQPSGPRELAIARGIGAVFAGYLRDLPPGHAGEADYVLARYEAGDLLWPRSANGVFAFAIIDPARDRCVLGVDRLGLRPLHFTHDSEGLAFAEDLGVVAAWTPRIPDIDHDTVQELAALGFPLTSRTALRGIERVPPGTCVELHAKGRKTTRYWSFEAAPSIRAQTPERFVDESAERLQHALGRLFAPVGTPFCLLSSGYDSRRLLLEGHALGLKFATATAVLSYHRQAGTTIEPMVVQEICRRLGVPNELVMQPAATDADGAALCRRVRDTLLDLQVVGRHHVSFVPLVRSLAPPAGAVNVDGMLGDTLFNNPFFSLPRALWGQSRPATAVLEAIAPDHLWFDRAWDGLISRSLWSRVETALREVPEGPNRLSFFFLAGRTARMVALFTYGLLDYRLDSLCPYADLDVMDHALTFDPVRKGELRLQKLALARRFPMFADIPSSHSALAEIPAGYVTAFDGWDPDLPRRLRSSDVWQLVRGRRGGGQPRADGADMIFGALDAVGVNLGGSWRERRLRRVLHAQDIERVFRSMDGAAQTRRRREAMAWLLRTDDPREPPR